MERTIDINQIINQIERLDYNNKINILAKLVNLIKREEMRTQHTTITKLKGMGKEVWKDVNIDNYLLNERDSWD